MDAPALDALNLAERLRGESQEFWLHLETASPLEKYPAKQHARRVQEKLGVKHGLIYLPGAPARNNEDSDMPAPFRQRRYFYYLSGCNEPDCHLTYDIQRDTLTLFIPRVNPSRVIWNGRGSTPSEAFDKYDIDEVYFIDELQDFLQDWLKFCSGLLYILHNSQNPLIPDSYGRIDSRSLQPAMNLTRVVKDDHEIKLIQKANDISSRAHKEVLANILDFTNEAQVQGLFLNVCVSEQAKQQAYDPIAASGPNAGTLHYDANNEDFGDRQLMCLDAGCEYELYASDITRTFPLASKWPSKEAENIYNLVQRMQEECIERLAPGVRYLDLHILAHQIAIDGLLELGILHNGTREEIYKAGTSRAFFPHGLGHHVGLEVHDIGQSDLMSIVNPLYQKAPSLYPANYHVPVYDSKICQAPTDPQSGHLEEGMVVTVEPGIYFSAYALLHFYLPSPIHSRFINSEVVNRYMPVGGVRIEDDILITSRGYRNLTTAPKGQAMIDIIRNGKTHLSSLKHSSNRQSTVDAKPFELEETLIRAPGISRRTTQPRLKLVTKSATMPAVINPKRRSVDFEPFDGPSLFTNFKRSTTTTEENVQRWQEARRQSPEASLGTCLNSKQRNPICGDSSMKVRHAYIDLSSEDQDNLSPRSCSPFDTKAACKKCAILVQTLDRLRQNLTLSGQESSIQSQEQKHRVEPTATRKMLGTEQSRPLANTTSEKFGHCHGGSKLPRDAETGQLSPPLQSDSRRVSSMPPSEHELRAKTSAHFSRGIGEPTRRQSANSKPWHNRLLAIGDQGQASRQSLHFPRPSYDQGLPEGFDEERNLRFHSTQRQPHSRPSLPILPSEPSVPITTTLTPFLANKTSPSQHESNSPRRYHVTWPNAEEQMALKGLPHCFQPKHYMRAICRHLPNQTSCNRCVDGLENLGSEHGVKRPHAQLCEAGSAQLQRSFDKLSIHHEPEHKVANNNGLGR